MNIYPLLRDDHDHVKDLFKQLKRKKTQPPQDVFSEIRKAKKVLAKDQAEEIATKCEQQKQEMMGRMK